MENGSCFQHDGHMKTIELLNTAHAFISNMSMDVALWVNQVCKIGVVSFVFSLIVNVKI